MIFPGLDLVRYRCPCVEMEREAERLFKNAQIQARRVGHIHAQSLQRHSGDRIGFTDFDFLGIEFKVVVSRRTQIFTGRTPTAAGSRKGVSFTYVFCANSFHSSEERLGEGQSLTLLNLVRRSVVHSNFRLVSRARTSRHMVHLVQLVISP